MMNNKKRVSSPEILLIIAIVIIVIIGIFNFYLISEYASKPVSELPIWAWWLLR